MTAQQKEPGGQRLAAEDTGRSSSPLKRAVSPKKMGQRAKEIQGKIEVRRIREDSVESKDELVAHNSRVPSY